MTIVLDPGHGQYGNQYPPQPAYYEGTQMWKLANHLQKELEEYGFKVISTRPRIIDNLSEVPRGEVAGTNKADLFLSLHSNALTASQPEVTGTVAFRPIINPSIGALADKLGNRVAELMGHYYRGCQTKAYSAGSSRDWYGVIRGAVESGCKNALILEHGFHTNPEDAAFLIVDDNLKKLALAEAAIIADYFGMKKPAPSKVVYKVQVGAFTVKSNAEALLEKLNKDGYAGFIVAIGDQEPAEPIPVEPAPPPAIKKGDKVKVIKAVTFAGGSFMSYYPEYDVIELKGDRAVIAYKGVVAAAIHVDNLQLI